MSVEKNDGNGILFFDSIRDFDFMQYAGHILHILCTEGSMSFVFHNVRYNISAGDYIILSTPQSASDFITSADCRTLVMSFTEEFFASMAIRSNYGFTGRLALLQNPVMRLSEHDFRKCETDLLRLRRRVKDTGHLFYGEMTGHLLMAHVLDLYDIHSRSQAPVRVPERAATLLHRFIEMLCRGEYVRHRNLDYYASALCVTPHYLSEICRKTSGEPASFWIDRFTLYEVVRQLRRKELTLAEVARRMHFSSLSYFTRYVRKQLGVTPSDYRNSFVKD